MRREELGLSQDELAKKIGYTSRTSINKIEKSEQGLPRAKIKAIADALGTSPEYIMGWRACPPEREAACDVAEACHASGAYDVARMYLDLTPQGQSLARDIIGSVHGDPRNVAGRKAPRRGRPRKSERREQ